MKPKSHRKSSWSFSSFPLFVVISDSERCDGLRPRPRTPWTSRGWNSRQFLFSRDAAATPAVDKLEIMFSSGPAGKRGDGGEQTAEEQTGLCWTEVKQSHTEILPKAPDSKGNWRVTSSITTPHLLFCSTFPPSLNTKCETDRFMQENCKKIQSRFQKPLIFQWIEFDSIL